MSAPVTIAELGREIKAMGLPHGGSNYVRGMADALNIPLHPAGVALIIARRDADRLIRVVESRHTRKAQVLA